MRFPFQQFIKLISLSFLLVLFLPDSLFADNIKGVRFKPSGVGIDDRTGIDISKFGTLKYKQEFSIRFDLSLRSYPSLYGNVFQLKDVDNDHQISLMLKLGDNSPDLFILYNNQLTNLQFDLSPVQIKHLNQWRTIKLRINTISKIASLQIGEDKITDTIISFPKNSAFNLVFGSVRNKEFEPIDIPAMSIRNIQYSSDGQLNYEWPLYPSNEDVQKDNLQHKRIQIHNPVWEAVYHSVWEHIDSFEVNGIPQIVFDEDKENLYLILKSGDIISYDLAGRYSELISTSGNPILEEAQQVYINDKGEIVSYSFKNNSLSVFDQEDSRWLHTGDSANSLPKYWHHNKFIHPILNTISTFGGYGFYTFNNKFQYYHKNDSCWKTLNLNGDIIDPRYLSSSCLSNENNLYVFGGIGNKSGNQDFGKKFYYDLHKIDLRNNNISKVWDLSVDRSDNFTPVNSMIIDVDNDLFYTLCFAHNKTKTSLQLMKASLDKPNWEFLGSKIPYEFNEIESFANLYYWKSKNRLLALTLFKVNKDRYVVKLYTLNFPPVNLVNPSNQSKRKLSNIVLLLAISFLAISLLIYTKGKRKNKSSHKIPDLQDSSKNDQSKILFFGGLSFIKSNGEDLTSHFTPILKELFLLIFLHSLNDNKGISSLQIDELIWPDKSHQNAKNNRGVNITRLRQLLEELGNVNVIYNKKFWKISIGTDVFCDLCFVLQSLNKGNFQSTENLNKVLCELSKGDFLPNTRNENIDAFKDNITGRVIGFLENVCLSNFESYEEDLLIKIVDTIFIYDRLNESALKYKCKLLTKQGKHMLAKETYNHFQVLYKKLYNEDFGVSFKELTK